jgi:hypothetical protein
MSKLMKHSVLAAALSLLALAGARASPATYTFAGDIVGVLNGLAVSGRLTLTVAGDTDDLTTSGPVQRLASDIVSTFQLNGIGSFTVTNEAYLFARADLGIVGFGVQGLPFCCDIIQIRDPALAGYDLNDDIGPVLGAPNPSLPDWVDVPTSAGLFTVTSMFNNSFQAVTTPTSVSEPATPALLALAGAGAWVAGRRRAATARVHNTPGSAP